MKLLPRVVKLNFRLEAENVPKEGKMNISTSGDQSVADKKPKAKAKTDDEHRPAPDLDQESRQAAYQERCLREQVFQMGRQLAT